MRIAYFLDVPEYVGGAGTLLMKQAKLMQELHEIIVVIPVNEAGVENPYYAKWCEDYAIKHIGMKYKTATNFRDVDVMDAVSNVSVLVNFFRKESIEFAHSIQLNVACEMASRQAGIPHLMNIYQLRDEEFLFHQNKDMYAHFHLCDSFMYSEIWKQKMGIESRCLRPLASTQEMSDRDLVQKKCYTIIMLGLLCERKNQLMAIQAVEKLNRCFDLQLLIVGDDQNRYGDRCKAYVEEHGLSDVVEFYGFTSDVDVILERGDWFLMSSIDESFPSSIVEAVSHGLIVVSTPVAGVPEVFVNRENAFISSDFSVDSMVNTLLECYKYCQNGEIVAIQKEAEKTWNTEFSLASNQKKIDEYYRYIFSANAKEIRSPEIGNEYIDSLKESIAEFALCRNRERFTDKIYYYKYLVSQLRLKNLHKAYIWGAGLYGEIAYDFLCHVMPDIELIGFLDKKKTGEYLGKPVERPDQIVYSKDTFVFMAFAADYWTGIDYLQQKGLVFGDQIWIIC